MGDKKMQYVGLQQQISKNNRNSLLLLITFPLLLLGMFYVFFFFAGKQEVDATNQQFLGTMPFVLIGVGIWFLVAWFGHSTFIRLATGSKPLERKEIRIFPHDTQGQVLRSGLYRLGSTPSRFLQ